MSLMLARGRISAQMDARNRSLRSREGVFHLYMVTCISTGKKYVVITSRTIAKRWKAHCVIAANGSAFHLHRAIRKYGAAQFIVRSLGTASSWSAVCAKEQRAIIKHRTFGKCGYNSTRGGEGILGCAVSFKTRQMRSSRFKKQWAALKFRKRRVAELKNAWANQEARARLSAALKEASKRPEVKERHRAAAKRRFSSPQARLLLRASAKKRANRPEAVARQRSRMRAHWANPSAMARQKVAMKRAWADPRRKARWRESLRRGWEKRRAAMRAST
jgi:hypothetical protein